MVHLVKMYENEIEQLRNSNSEQTQDLHTLIQTVSDLKREQKDLLDKLQAKDERLHSFQQEHEHEIRRIQSQTQEELLKQSSQIQLLNKQREEDAQKPSNAFVKDIQAKTQEIAQL